MRPAEMWSGSESDEWLEADGLGGFASGTTSGVRTRRYHALLLTATTPPTGRMVLVNGFEARVEAGGERYALTTQRYAPDVLHPDGGTRLLGFQDDPWPTWTFGLPGGLVVVQELFVPRDRPETIVTWTAASAAGTPETVALEVRPLLSGRDMHALHAENDAFAFDAAERDGTVTWRPYATVPAISCRSDGAYRHEPLWYRSFLYAEERARGLDHLEDLASPGSFRWTLRTGGGASDRPRPDVATWILRAVTGDRDEPRDPDGSSPGAHARAARASERARRAGFASRLHRAGDAYLVRRGDGATIIAGYPWFGDWGRDTFLALRGLCLATGRLDEAGQILHRWAEEVSGGMLPNRFVEQGDAPEFNSVDAALWFVVAVDEYFEASRRAGREGLGCQRGHLEGAIEAILAGTLAGTRHGIHVDSDGLLAAGEPGIQLTWMDARVGDWVVTPRIGKPVEIQALWANALCAGARFDAAWRRALDRVLDAFEARFWLEEHGFLADVVDVDHRPGEVDATLRPNQILAIGGLPLALLDGERAARALKRIETSLWTPLGLRSLDPASPDYRPRYVGGVLERDGAYHQGTAWPWLLGPFVEAWVRVRGGGASARREARQRFLRPLLAHLREAGLGHVSEIADADAPHVPRGCPFQAWSVGEALRLTAAVLAEPPRIGTARPSPHTLRLEELHT